MGADSVSATDNDNGTFLSFLTLAEGVRGAYLPLSAKALKAVSCRRRNGQLNGNVEAKSC